MYFYVRIHKACLISAKVSAVVNWFQIVFLREDSQALLKDFRGNPCCELISNCIFTWGFTSDFVFHWSIHLLWIDFKLYFYVRIHKNNVSGRITELVVNWFQIVFLREDSQEKKAYKERMQGCELISNCIFTWGFTRTYEYNCKSKSLWIDFKLYFYVRIHKFLSIIVI